MIINDHKRCFTIEINNIDLVNNMSDDLKFMNFDEISAIIYDDDVIMLKRLLSPKQYLIRSLYMLYHSKRIL